MPTGPVTISLEGRALGVWLNKGVEKAAFRALKKAGTSAARAMLAASNRSVRFRKRFKVADVKKALPVTYPKSGRKDIESLVWTMRVSGKAFPLAAFPYRETRKGVIVRVNKGKGQLVKGVFVATMASGHVGIFKRVKGQGRLPIREAYTTRISDVFDDAGMIPAVQARTQAVFSRDFERLFPLELDKLSDG